MYSIGEFSKIGRVTTKTLRYYDAIGLLQPAYVDQENHYRYYDKQQVSDLLLIAELKSYDLRLEQIKAVLEDKNKSLLEHFLRERMLELERQMQDSIRLKRSIEKKMQQIQSGGLYMMENGTLAVTAEEFTPVYVISKKATIEITNVGSVIGSLYEQIYKEGLTQSGPVMTLYFDQEFHPESANIEVCIPVEETTQAKNLENGKVFAPGTCASCTYVGPYGRLGEAYAAVMDWIKENGHEVSAAPFDAYMTRPEDVKSPEENVTKVYFPIK